jgi:hypothetical protein
MRFPKQDFVLSIAATSNLFSTFAVLFLFGHKSKIGFMLGQSLLATGMMIYNMGLTGIFKTVLTCRKLDQDESTFKTTLKFY